MTGYIYLHAVSVQIAVRLEVSHVAGEELELVAGVAGVAAQVGRREADEADQGERCDGWKRLHRGRAEAALDFRSCMTILSLIVTRSLTSRLIARSFLDWAKIWGNTGGGNLYAPTALAK